MSASESIFATRTTTRLLDALRDHGNEPVWAHIDQRYRPVIAGLARRLGLNSSEADEVAQQTLASFVQSYRSGRYDRSKGRLSSWILGIAHYTALDVHRARKATSGANLDALPDVPDESELRTIWTDERDRTILNQAMGILRDESSMDDRTLLAFELVGLRGVPAAEAAGMCDMSTDQVYVAKSRVTRRLREIVNQLTEAFEEDT